MISSQQISALIAAQQQQLQILQRSLPSGQVPVPNLGTSQYPPSFSYGYSGAPTGTGASAALGGAVGALPVALGAAQTGAAVASMFGVNNAATAMLAPSFGTGAGAMLAGAAVPAAALAGTAFAANNFARGMQDFSGTQAILSQMRFANPAAAGGRGFSTQQQLGMYNMMSRIDAADPFTSMGDVQSMLRGFNDMKMSQGIRDAQEFSDKFKKMTETVKDMAKMMGTTIEGAMQSFGEMRRAGFVSGADLRGNVVDMMVAQGRGIDQGQFLGAQQRGASMLRARGMTGRFGARMVSGVSSAVMGGMQRGLYSGEELMDIFDTGSAGEASLQFGQELTGSISDFLMTGQGQAFLAATAERGPGGRFTGKLSQQKLTDVLRGGNIPDVLAKAGASIQGAGRESALSFVNSKTSLADEFMSRDSAIKDVVDMVRQYADRSGQPGDDMTKFLLKKFLQIDGLRAEKMMQLAKDYEAESASKLEEQMRELGSEDLSYKLKTRGTFAGISQYVSGTINDLGAGIRGVGASISASTQGALQSVQDYFAGIERTPLNATSGGGGAMGRAIAAGVTIGDLGVSQQRLAASQQQLQIMRGEATTSMYEGGLKGSDKQFADAALADSAKRKQIEQAIARAQITGDTSKVSQTIQGIVGTGGTAASGDVSGYVLSKMGESGKAVLRAQAQAGGVGNPFFGVGSPIEKAIETAQLSEGRLGSSARGAATELFTGEGAAGRLGLTTALVGQGMLGTSADKSLVNEELVRLDNLGLLKATDAEGRRAEAAQSLYKRLLDEGKITKEMGSAEDLLAIDKYANTYGGANASKMFASVAAGHQAELFKGGISALNMSSGIFAGAGLGGEIDKLVQTLATGGDYESAMKGLLLSGKVGEISESSDPLLKKLGQLSATYKGLGKGDQTLAEFAKSIGRSESVATSGVSPERLQSLLSDSTLSLAERQELVSGMATGELVEQARQRAGGGGVVFDKDNPQPSINDLVYRNLESLTEQNRLNLQAAQGKAGAPVVATPGSTAF